MSAENLCVLMMIIEKLAKNNTPINTKTNIIFFYTNYSILHS